MIPAAVVLFIWMKIRNSIRFHRESVKRRRHERKLKFLQTNRIRETILDQPTNEEIGQDLAKQFPIREGVIYKMKMRKELEKKYLAFRRLRLTQEMSNGALLQKSMNDKLDLPEQFTALELVCDAEQSIVEEANFHKDPEFVIGSIAMEYDIVKMDSKRK
ncbi:VHS domain-containing protein [Caenorhabditis elegans]|nr:VHS domain-containing protein [Caenorhabditis elegans]CBK19390.1 VHS domain-containing protein [Caenorhabditis elegans]|eukprot:NP_001255711.1 Uncharacterized protein CELE_C48D1.9 [Caenorhabditis elegans]